MECVKSRSKDNIRISPRLPGADMVRSRKKFIDLSYAFFPLSLSVNRGEDTDDSDNMNLYVSQSIYMKLTKKPEKNHITLYSTI